MTGGAVGGSVVRMLDPKQQQVFDSLTTNARVRVVFAEVTDPIWIRPVQYDFEDEPEVRFVDAADDTTFSTDQVAIVRGDAVTRRVSEVREDWICLVDETRESDDGGPVTIHVTAAHLREVEVLEPGDRWNRRETTIPGLDYTFVQRPDGILEVGCQKIPREGQEQIVRLLAERLDLEVRSISGGA